MAKPSTLTLAQAIEAAGSSGNLGKQRILEAHMAGDLPITGTLPDGRSQTQYGPPAHVKAIEIDEVSSTISYVVAREEWGMPSHWYTAPIERLPEEVLTLRQASVDRRQHERTFKRAAIDVSAAALAYVDEALAGKIRPTQTEFFPRLKGVKRAELEEAFRQAMNKRGQPISRGRKSKA